MIALVLAGAGRRVTNIIVGPNEVGGGTMPAAEACHFDALVPSGARRKVGTPVDEALADLVTVRSVRVRTSEGTLRSPQDIDAEVRRLVEASIAAGDRVLLHLVAHSKTGVHAPTQPTLDDLTATHGDRIVGMVDAAQGRVSRRVVREGLERGYIVLFTGSKFYGGPPFSGALLVPPHLGEAAVRGAGFPAGFSDYFTAAEMPARWLAARRSLPDRPNWGAMLRWLAALEEIRAFYHIDPAVRRAVLHRFEQSAPRLLATCPAAHLMPAFAPFDATQDERTLESSTTVFSLKVEIPGQGFLPKPALHRWVRLLNADLTGRLALACSSSRLEAARQPFQVGQPVALGTNDGGANAVLRVALGASLVTSLAEDETYGATLDDRLAWLDRHLALLADKMTLLAERWAEFEDVEGLAA